VGCGQIIWDTDIVATASRLTHVEHAFFVPKLTGVPAVTFARMVPTDPRLPPCLVRQRRVPFVGPHMPAALRLQQTQTNGERLRAIYDRFLHDLSSPWNTNPWTLDLKVAASLPIQAN
jgi:hypothetical protein